MAQFKIIAAVDSNMGIARAGQKPWHLPEEESYFHSQITRTESPQLRNALLMEPTVWKSLLSESRHYTDLLNVLIAPADQMPHGLPPEILHFESLQEALDELGDRNDLDELFVIGGGQLFAEAILHPDLEEIHLTHLEGDFDCDAFFPKEIPGEFEVVSSTDLMESDGLEYSFVVLGRQSESESDANQDY